LLLTLFLGNNPTFGFETLGIQWPDGVVGFRIHANFPDTEVTGDTDRQIELLSAAAQTWQDQTRAAFRFRLDGTTTRDSLRLNDGINAVFFSEADGGDALAVTLLGPRPSGDFAFDMAFFATTFGRPNVWSGFGEPTGDALDLLGIAVHEFGHALGLAHSRVQGATMSPAIAGRGVPFRTLESDDRAGVESLYSPEASTPEPSLTLDSVAPRAGLTTGGNEVVIAGGNFTFKTETQVIVGGLRVDPSRWEVESPSRIRVHSMPPGLAGAVDIEVQNSLGSARLEQVYAYESVDFLRGDSTSDVQLDLTDASFTLSHIFLRGPRPSTCRDAADTDDDGFLTISDAIYLLNFLFLGGPEPPSPFPNAGSDPTQDNLDC